ncbi:MAG TPA: hypothetical protein VI968_00075 [archaeon]|nr:hypothetical protein [archaeon]
MLNDILGSFTQFIAHLDSYDIVFSLLLYTFIIFVYSVFVWFFYRTLSKRDLFHLAIKEQRHAWRKQVFYIIKYLVFFPVFTFLWFAIMSLIMIMLSKSYTIEAILVISMAMIAATRITAYYNRQLSEDIAKILPLGVLAIFIVDPSYFSFSLAISRLYELQTLISLFVNYLVFIIALEFVLRVLLVVTRRVRQKLFPVKQKEQVYGYRPLAKK